MPPLLRRTALLCLLLLLTTVLPTAIGGGVRLESSTLVPAPAVAEATAADDLEAPAGSADAGYRGAPDAARGTGPGVGEQASRVTPRTGSATLTPRLRRVNGTRFAPTGPVTAPPRVRARAWAVADLETGRLVGVHRARARLPMASTIKLLSAVTAVRTVPPFPDHKVTRREAHPEHCSCAGLKVGGTYTRRALMAGMLLPSGNDAAEALAGSHPRGRRAFIRAMNRVAAGLGAADTHAANPSGLTAPGGASSARDLLTLLRAAQADRRVEPLLDLSSFRFGPRFGRKHTIHRTTDYVNTYVQRWPGTQGKSGFTTPAKNTLVVTTPIRGHLIGVAILGAPPGTITDAARRLTVWAARNLPALGHVGRLPR